MHIRSALLCLIPAVIAAPLPSDVIESRGLLSSIASGLSGLLNPSGCALTGVHIIVARASTEAPGEGSLKAVADAIISKLPGSDAVAVDYPATLDNYPTSEGSGVTAMTNMIQNYVKQCPKSKIVLLGYSQGAQVIGDVLFGNSETWVNGTSGIYTTTGFNTTQPLASTYANQIAAVIQMGDPSHVAGMPYNAGTSTRSGVFPRQNNANAQAWASRIQSYCDTDDMYCDSGSSIGPHLLYIQNYGLTAVNFVVQKSIAALLSLS